MTKVIVGLGNPGKNYEKTRHNIGFMAVDLIASEAGAPWREKPKFKADIAEISVATDKVYLVKPSTFYNLAGESVRAIKDFYNLQSSDILVIHDELDLPFGTIRTRVGGSPAGNNGIKSISQHIGEDFARIRIGTANEYSQQRPAEVFVLERFSSDEMAIIPKIFKEIIFLTDNFMHSDKEFSHTSIKTE